jgi:hypothetical protein
MKKKPSHGPTLNAAELQLIEQLRKYPETRSCPLKTVKMDF